MAKEFDVYLHKRLTECDVYVYSLTLRDGLTAVYRMILDSHVDSIMMQRFGGADSAIELSSSIEELTKHSHETVKAGIELSAAAGFLKQTSTSPGPVSVVIEPRLTEIYSCMASGAESSVQIAVDPILPQTGLSPGRVTLSTMLDVSDIDFFKTGILEIVPQLTVSAEVIGEQKVTKVSLRADLDLSSEIVDLCFRFYTGGLSAVQMESSILDTEISHSFGRMGTAMEIQSEILGGSSFEVGVSADTSLHIGTEAFAVLEKVARPMELETELNAAATFSIKRRRILSEMDGLSLEDFDDMTRHDVDYITIS